MEEIFEMSKKTTSKQHRILASSPSSQSSGILRHGVYEIDAEIDAEENRAK